MNSIGIVHWQHPHKAATVPLLTWKNVGGAGASVQLLLGNDAHETRRTMHRLSAVHFHTEQFPTLTVAL
jgi:hypothetical protein